MRTILTVFLLAVVWPGCKKEANRKQLDAYFNYTANGVNVNISQGILLNENLFQCRAKGDTALQIIVSKSYNGAGIFITNPAGIADGTYTLGGVNRAYYLHPADQKKYTTTTVYNGTVTIKYGTLQAKDLLQTVKGTFAFTAADTLTGKKFEITNGSFYMEVE